MIHDIIKDNHTTAQDEHAIPQALTELQSHPWWCNFKKEKRVETDDKDTKVPYHPSNYRASSSKSATWSTHKAVVRACRIANLFSGIGFFFNGQIYSGIDIDDCVDENGVIAEWAWEIIRLFDSYTEFSTNGRGVHIVVKGLLQIKVLDKDGIEYIKGWKNNPPVGDVPKGKLELYSERRFFVVTGRHVAGTPTTINERQDELLSILNTFFLEPKAEKEREFYKNSPKLPSNYQPAEIPQNDNDLWQIMFREKGNGRRWERLYYGDASDYMGDDGRIDESAADAAIAAKLVFYTQHDPSRVERMMWQTELARDKWKSHPTYLRQLTIENAMKKDGDYDPLYYKREQKDTTAARSADSEAPSKSFEEIQTQVKGAIDGKDTMKLYDLAEEVGCLPFKEREFLAGTIRSGMDKHTTFRWSAFKKLTDAATKAQETEAKDRNKASEEDGEESQVNRLLRISKQATYFRVPSGMLYARVPINGHWETLSINEMNSGLKRWLTYVFLKETGAIPNKDLLSQAINAIVSVARYEAQQTDVHTRITEHDGCIYLDLANDEWECVRISPEGWTIVTDPPVFFRRPNGLLPLPIPERGGSITELKTLVNLASNEDYYLTVGWLLGTLHPKGPYPGLSLNGGQGTGKSFATVTLKSITDPNVAPTKSSPKDERDMAIAAQNSHVLGLDNLSSMPVWLSDLLCKVSTGSGFSTRKLHTDDEETIFYACRPFVLNGIEDTLISRPDLLNRSILVNLEKIDPAKRRTERKLKQAFKNAHPRILGSLLDAAVVALREIGNVSLDGLPRMADFCEWVTAAESALGWEQGTFMKTFVQNQNNASSIAIEASPVARAVKRYMSDRTEWEGMPTDLYKELAKYEDLSQEKNWPGNARSLSGALARVSDSLYAQGVNVFIAKRTGKGRKITLSTVPPNGTNPPDDDKDGVANGVAKPDGVANGVANSEFATPDESPLQADLGLNGVASVAKSDDFILSQFIKKECEKGDTEGIEDVVSINSADFATLATLATPAPQDADKVKLLSEYHTLYLQVAQSRKKLAPLGDIHWRVPDSGFEEIKQISPDEYARRIQAIYESNDYRRLRAGMEEMQRILRIVEGR